MKKEKGKKKKKIIIYIALLLIILYVFYTVFLLTVQSTKLFTVEQGKIYLEETLNGYIIRDETVVKGENYKNGMEQIKTEGEKTAKNESVFRYYSQNETDLKQKISELDEKIQTALKESENLITSDGLSAEVKTIENKIDEKTKEISKLTDMSKIAEYKKEINEYLYNIYKDKMMYSYNENEHVINNLFLNEISILKVKNSNIKIDTNYDKCTFLKDLRYFNGILFVCNFKEQEYFFIKNVRNYIKN